MLKYMDGWNKFVAAILCFLFFVAVIAMAYINFRFWQSRSKKIDHIVKVGDQAVAIPLYSNLLQNIGEIWGINIAVVGPVYVFLIYLFAVLTGADVMRMVGSDNYFLMLIIGRLMHWDIVIYLSAILSIVLLVYLLFHWRENKIKLVLISILVGILAVIFLMTI